ncbi:MAG: alpha-L-fucosidase, partial [Lentimicrobiaceae bacterium]|nr:alpha-L-fucosidase [Lentimicrobiaceae bacterium]
MKPTKITLLFLMLAITCSGLFAQENELPKEERLAWFKDAKLGIFIHWGIYSVGGIDESWSFYNGYIPYDDYMKQLTGFTAEKYNPVQWAQL